MCFQEKYMKVLFDNFMYGTHDTLDGIQNIIKGMYTY